MLQRAIRWYDYITINSYWFSLTVRSQTLASLLVPVLVQQFVGEAAKGSYVGIIRLWALMVAVLVQALMGILSDRSTLPWGRRRPFILIGTMVEMFVFAGIGYISAMDGMAGFWMLFGLYILSMIASNTAHAATQGLIPDLVPENLRGKFSGVKVFFDLPLPLIFVSLVIGRMVAAGNVVGGLVVMSVAMLVGMALAMFAPEQQHRQAPSMIDWQPFVRLLVMTGVFAAVILGSGAGVSWFSQYLSSMPGLDGTWVIGIIGLAGMIVAVLVGVWGSLAVGLSTELRTENRSFSWWVINRLMFMVASVNLSAFFVYFLQERFPELAGQKAAGPASTIVMFVGIFILVSSIPSGFLTDRLGKKMVSLIGALVGTLGTFGIIFSPAISLMYVGGCLVGIGFGMFYTANWALGTAIVPKEEAGRFLGLSNLAGAGAGAIGAYIGGPIGDAVGYTPLLIIYGLLLLLSVLTLIGIEEPK
jgi:MFS family permease